MNTLVDTSVWLLALRRPPKDLTAAEQSVVRELAELTREGRARIIGLIRQELLSGIRTAAQYEKLRVALVPFPMSRLIPLTTKLPSGPAMPAGQGELLPPSWTP